MAHGIVRLDCVQQRRIPFGGVLRSVSEEVRKIEGLAPSVEPVMVR